MPGHKETQVMLDVQQCVQMNGPLPLREIFEKHLGDRYGWPWINKGAQQLLNQGRLEYLADGIRVRVKPA